MVAHDFNHDGAPDIVAAADYWSVRTFLNDGTGQMNQGPLEGTLYTPTDIALADVNGDSHTDLAVSGFGTSFLLGNGQGSFAAGGLAEGLRQAKRVHFADVTADGVLDLLTLSSGDGQLHAARATGGGNFAEISATDGGSIQDFVVADFNLDGRPDVAACHNVYEVSVLLASASGWASPQRFQIRPLSWEAAATSLIAADLNADGRPDLAITNAYHRSIEILLSQCQ